MAHGWRVDKAIWLATFPAAIEAHTGSQFLGREEHPKLSLTFSLAQMTVPLRTNANAPLCVCVCVRVSVRRLSCSPAQFALMHKLIWCGELPGRKRMRRTYTYIYIYNCICICDIVRLYMHISCWSVWSGLVWSGLAWPGLVWSGLVWSVCPSLSVSVCLFA